jgi:hypothetical protein
MTWVLLYKKYKLVFFIGILPTYPELWDVHNPMLVNFWVNNYFSLLVFRPWKDFLPTVNKRTARVAVSTYAIQIYNYSEKIQVYTRLTTTQALLKL